MKICRVTAVDTAVQAFKYKPIKKIRENEAIREEKATFRTLNINAAYALTLLARSIEGCEPYTAGRNFLTIVYEWLNIYKVLKLIFCLNKPLRLCFIQISP